MTHPFENWSAAEVVGFATCYFAALYGIAGFVTWWMSQHLCPAIGYGRKLDRRPLRDGQIRREIAQSIVSIVIFGVGALVPWLMLRLGWASLASNPGWWQIIFEIGVLFLWNELHFYVNHRLLHTRVLRRFHAAHHASVTPTPFSTYAFHPVEALLLGSVPLIPMLAHDFSFAALLLLPVMSIALNNLGHANYEFSRTAPARGWRAASRRHHLHHACYHGNYGFLLDVFDRLGGSVLLLDAAADRLPNTRNIALD